MARLNLLQGLIFGDGTILDSAPDIDQENTRVSDLESVGGRIGCGGSSLALASGNMYGTLAVAKKSFTAANMKYCMGTAAGAGVTHAYLAIYRFSDKALLARTADDTTIATATASTIVTKALNTPSTLAIVQGTKYILAIGAVFSSTAPQIRSANIQGVLSQLSPQMLFGSSGWTTTPPDPIGTGALSVMPWIAVTT